jgi:two-component system response regulator RegA
MTKTIILIDDDEIFCQALSRAITKYGWQVYTAHNGEQGMDLAKTYLPNYAIIDLKMPGASGLTFIKRLLQINKDIKIIMLTGYASIATAVEAIKLGAIHYLVKPVDVEEILATFYKDEGDCMIYVKPTSLSAERLKWEYIQQTLAKFNGNISQTARMLGMHRRTLQRKLAKRPVFNETSFEKDQIFCPSNKAI